MRVQISPVTPCVQSRGLFMKREQPPILNYRGFDMRESSVLTIIHRPPTRRTPGMMIRARMVTASTTVMA